MCQTTTGEGQQYTHIRPVGCYVIPRDRQSHGPKARHRLVHLLMSQSMPNLGLFTMLLPGENVRVDEDRELNTIGDMGAHLLLKLGRSAGLCPDLKRGVRQRYKTSSCASGPSASQRPCRIQAASGT